MKTLLTIIVTLWSLRIAGNILAYVALWWVKEYRFDRMLIHLRTPQGRRFLLPAWKRPPFSPKTTLLAALTGINLMLLVLFLPFSLIINLIIADLLTFPLTWLWVFILNLPTKLYHAILIKLAVHKLRKHRPMVVVGITGSYGKTSTKEYLGTILASKHSVLKTEASKNSPIGIAEVIMSSLRTDHEVFVVEMGAYKKGEIADMAKMVNPQVGIITAINPQHQDLFGSIENTMKAKYELIRGLSGRRIAIFNADDDRVRQMGEWARRDGCEVWWWSKKISNIKYSLDKARDWQISNKRTFLAQDINATLSGVEFIGVLGNKKVKVQAPALGEHQVSNILAAIAGAVACGMTLAEATKAASGIQPTPKVMELTIGINGSTFINDTFNNNPDAAKAVLDFLNKAKGRRILVFQPMIELGRYAEVSHEEVGEYAGRICDDIVLTNNNWYEHFWQGVRRVSPSTPVLILSPQKAADYIRGKVKKGDMVVFKGKEAEHVFRLLQKMIDD